MTQRRPVQTIARCGAAALAIAAAPLAFADKEPPEAPPPTSSVVPAAPIISGDTGRFEFGSYGRVRIASDVTGKTGHDANVVAHGDRIDEESYAELELRREDRFTPEIASRVVATLALFPPFFHFSGDATQAIAVRNLYAQGSYADLTLWVGSRMYRGDDIYLLDWWPLDNQNTLGGGASYKFGSQHAETSAAVHVGMQRLDSTYQHETLPAPVPSALTSQQGPTSEDITVLDRPRTIETLKVTHLLRSSDPERKDGLKFVLYGEAQELSAGAYTDTTVAPPGQTPLPADGGWLVGTEVAYFTGKRDTFVQIFLRHAEGIAAYDPLATPLTFANNRTTRGSTETLLAVGANYEWGPFGILFGGYMRAFRGGVSATTSQKYDEGVLAIRPQFYLSEHWGIAAEGAFEAKRFAVLDPNIDQPLIASEWRAGIIPYFSPSGRGSYRRPQLRVIYSITARNSGTRELFPAEDVVGQRAVEQFLGLGAEWWFNSSSYP